MNASRAPAWLVGIDLGTTNTVLAYAAPGTQQVATFAIEQLVAPGEVAPGLLLPSARYHPAPGELAAGALQLPWLHADLAGVPDAVVGRLARLLGAHTPGRLVASAKSWLSHHGVDRTAAILPWGAPEDVPKVSPVAASASYLAYLRAAWDARHPGHPLAEQDLVLTVPASFDEGARALTLEAARLAGLPSLRLLEEPQAALYDWLHRHRATLNEELAGTRLVLVADVGGGTTDFSLVKVELEDGSPKLTRIGVGNHLILGGDNMDLALAHLVEARLLSQDKRQDGQQSPQARLSAVRLAQLTERCRSAKEQLLAPDAPDQVSVTLLGAGSRLVGASRTAQLTRDDIERIVLDGFFPLNGSREGAKRARAGIVEFGLPYASDPAITRHLADFLRQHARAAREALGLDDDGNLPVPDTLLLNGGVFRAVPLAQRLADTLSSWRGQPVRVLHNADPDVAVARGGVAYSLARQGLAPAIESGSARSYFLLLDGVPGSGKLKAVCLLPRGEQPGIEVRLAERSFGLRLGRPVRFHLVSTTADPQGSPPQPGDLLELDPGEVVRLPAIATVLRARKAEARAEIPVQLAASLSEVGTLDVHCVAEDGSGQRWKLEFQLRGLDEEAHEDEADSAAMPPQLDQAIARIDRIFGARNQQVESREVRQLRGALEHLLGSRERWETPLLRRLFDALLERARGRRRSAEHERVWLNLAGWCLRPGFGDPLDEWRIEQLWALFEAGAQYHKDSQVRAEWWTLWRRVAGGLSIDAQLRLLDDFAFNLQAEPADRARRPVTLVDGSEDDMLRLGASLERIPSAYKVEIGDWMMQQIMAIPAMPKLDPKTAATYARYLWALARVGARQSLQSSAHEVASIEAAERWLENLLRLDWKRIEPAGFAAAHIARKTGDRSRDIGEPLREQVLHKLAASGAPPSWAAMVRDVVELDQASTARMLGDALPPGLKLLR
ncbi:molecular chaperone DnaK [Massilia sp. WF1]|uniref:Hsp70 family protein n=1 Tax=unclassified Massilia TaxID=2609279 RepID=UPI00064936B2|nr:MULTISPECIES: Hsp70 family protein [unclassified Massilia]ALK98430.1 molecular chaperone DnaK [Massilia sp. WG5]KLU36994.1 molecular chaperone DnaK [Massilia sp. WF1]